MKLSYLVTCSTETDTLERLLDRIFSVLGMDDQLVILQDESVKSPETDELIMRFFDVTNSGYHKHPLDANYGAHKNYGNSLCKGDWIFQIDGDELPTENIIGENLHLIIESNPNAELIFVPRINDYRGVTPQIAAGWGWTLTESPTYHRPLVNWPDYQSRIYRNIPERIKWDRKLHEKIMGHTQYSFLPAEEDYALYHDKTIDKQIQTNIRYNKVFSVEDNKGHKIV